MTHFKLTTLFKAMVVLLLVILPAISWGADFDRQTFAMKLGGSELVQTQSPFGRVSIADPDIADVIVLSPRSLYVYGKDVGYTSIILWQANVGKTLLDVTVTLDLTGLKEKLATLYPKQDIMVHGSETGIVLSGTVTGPEIVEQVLRLAKTYLPRAGKGGSGGSEGAGKSGYGVTNLLKVAGIQQVQLEVKFAEVSRNHGKDWSASVGVNEINTNFAGVFGLGNLGVDAAGNLAGATTGSVLVNFINNPANIFASFDNGEVTSALKFLETEGLARILAEPRLVTMSGQEASFLAGGEIPIPVAQEGNIASLEFREFGVGLSFTPVVLSNGRISLHVKPSVTQLSTDAAISFVSGSTTYEIPSISTRKLETTVHLQDGQTLALAGLLQEELRESVDKIPGLGSLPIIGALFSSSNYKQYKTDLMIAVTPHLVTVNPEGTMKFPGEDFEAPNWYEFYIERRLEGYRFYENHPIDAHPVFYPDETPEEGGGMEGEFGHEPLEQS